MTTATADYSKIKSDITTSRRELSDQAAQIRKELGEQTAKLTQLQQAQAQKRTAYFRLQDEVTAAENALQLAIQEAELAHDTSLQSDRETKLAEAKQALAAAQEAFNSNQEALNADERQEPALDEQISALEDYLNGLMRKDQELATVYERYHREHAENVKSDHLAQLAAIDGQLEIAHKTLVSLEEMRADHLRTLARDLSPWPALAEQTLAEVIGEQQDTPAVTAVLDQLRETEAKRAEAKRAQKQADATYLDATLLGYEREISHLQSRVELLRKQARMAAATELLREVGVLSEPIVRAETAPLVVIERI